MHKFIHLHLTVEHNKKRDGEEKKILFRDMISENLVKCRWIFFISFTNQIKTSENFINTDKVFNTKITVKNC